MTREIVHEARYYCDGCGHAVVESTVDYIDQAFEQCGWLHTTTPLGAEMDYCPVCRADNPFEAVQRVRVLIDTADRFTPPLTLTTAELRRALDGDR